MQNCVRQKIILHAFSSDSNGRPEASLLKLEATLLVNRHLVPWDYHNDTIYKNFLVRVEHTKLIHISLLSPYKLYNINSYQIHELKIFGPIMHMVKLFSILKALPNSSNEVD